MTALVACETVLLVLLVVLVAGLLRSHAEILRRLGPAGTGDGAGTVLPRSAPATVRREPGTPAPEVAGTTPDGGAVKLALAGAGATPMLLAFLSGGCSTCHRFWEDLGGRRLPGELGLLVVTHDPSQESPSRLRTLTPPGVSVVMSSQAYEDYHVPGAPYFVLVDGSVRGEGVATTWAALESLLTDALADAGEEAAGAGRADRIESRLAGAGIAPGDPSLYPGSGEADPNSVASSPPGELAMDRARMPGPPSP
jgi:hypothetical protein